MRLAKFDISIVVLSGLQFVSYSVALTIIP